MAATTVLLVDWPNQDVPRQLVDAGLTVLSANFASGTASLYSLGPPGERESLQTQPVEVLKPEHDDDVPLTITRLDAMPQRVDVVALFRPQEEHARIVQNAKSLGAQVLWVQRGTLSDEARQIAGEAGLTIIEDLAMPDALQQLRSLAATD